MVIQNAQEGYHRGGCEEAEQEEREGSGEPMASLQRYPMSCFQELADG